MKNIQVLLTTKEREQFLKNIWKTEEFKKSFEEKGYIYHKTKDFINKPRIIAEMSDAKIEHSHFYSWFNIFIKKTYSNSTIEDLYSLHELSHITTLKHSHDMPYEEWQWKMLENEINASVESEVMVYKHLPIRSKSFSFKIWADTLDLKNLSKAEVYLKRVAASINPQNEVEEKIKQYKDQNFQWFELWKDTYLKIENFMSSNPSPKAMTKWIEQNSTNGILFEDKAKQFSWVYWKNNPSKTF